MRGGKQGGRTIVIEHLHRAVTLVFSVMALWLLWTATWYMFLPKKLAADQIRSLEKKIEIRQNPKAVGYAFPVIGAAALCLGLLAAWVAISPSAFPVKREINNCVNQNSN
jgi:purine-cytosine permease-like protein